MSLEVTKGIVRLEPGREPNEELGFRPRALVLWWCRERAGGCTGGVGFATDGGGGTATAWAADDASAPGVLRRCGADTPLLFHEDPCAPGAVAGSIRFAADGFSIDCGRGPEQEWLVHYLALGGSDLRDAAVRSLVLDRGGTHEVTGLGFAPELVLATAGGGSAVGGPQSGLAVAFGAAARSGGQIASGFVAQAGNGPTVVRGAQCSGAVAVLPAPAASGGLDVLSRLASFDRDGFVLETTQASSELRLGVLALAGGRYAAGLGHAGARRTTAGFEPAGALLFGTGLAAMSRARDIGRLCLGGFSRDRADCLSWSVRARGAWPLEPRSRCGTDTAFEVIDTTSDELHARATVSALGRRGFSLAWPIRDRYRRDFAFVAFGSKPRRPTLRDRLRALGRGVSPRE